MVSSSQVRSPVHHVRRWSAIGLREFYNTGMRDLGPAGLVMMMIVFGSCRPALAQVPLPFPRPAEPQKPGSQQPGKVEPPRKPDGAVPLPQKTNAPLDAPAPTEAVLGVPVYPSAEFLSTYDAGRG